MKSWYQGIDASFFSWLRLQKKCIRLQWFLLTYLTKKVAVYEKGV